MPRSQADRDHHANQQNPNNPAYQDMLDNRADQLNPNHDDDRDEQDQDKPEKSDD